MTDLLLTNARIWTGDTDRPWAEAAIAENGTFAFVGGAGDIAAASGTEVIDAGKRLVLPGLIDGHAHLLTTGVAMRSVDLKGVSSVEEAVRRVAERVERSAQGSWVQGAGWDQHLWPGGAFPDRRALDAVAPDHPIVLAHTSGHCVWLNSAALRASGIDGSTEPPFGGAIDHDADGSPTGILRDNASALIYDAVPRLSDEERRSALGDAIARAHSLGVTGAHAMDVRPGELRTLESLRDAGELQLRVRAFLSSTRLDDWIGAYRTGHGDGLLRVGGVKFFADGALGSLTAWMLEPYEGTDDTGMPLWEMGELEEKVRACLESGLAPAIHAIGDRANREVADILERTRAIAPELPRRIEHAQVLSKQDIARFGRLDITASVQPIHATQDMAKVDRYWGSRGQSAYAFASLLACGANLAFGSDSPVETIDPIAGIHAAVTRRDARGEPPDGWYPSERIALDEAITAYTSSCARATGEDRRLGKIAEGHTADFIVLSRDIFALDDEMGILDARVVRTVIGGETVYEGEGRN